MDSDSGWIIMNGVHIIPDFISAEKIQELQPLLISGLEKWRDDLIKETNPVLSVIKQEHKIYGNNIFKFRDTQNSGNTQLYKLVGDCIDGDRRTIESLFQELEPEEKFNITVMLTGGSVSSHTDEQIFPQGLRTINKVVLRDITSVCYLNDDYDGGELSFDLLGIKIKPKAGTFIFFPTAKIYKHSVGTVTNGERYSVSKFWNFKSL